MVLGTLRVYLYIPANSLKEKRRFISSIKDKLRKKFNISIAEIDSHDIWNYGVLGIVTVSNDRKYVNSILSSIVEFLQNQYSSSLANYEIEIL